MTGCVLLAMRVYFRTSWEVRAMASKVNEHGEKPMQRVRSIFKAAKWKVGDTSQFVSQGQPFPFLEVHRIDLDRHLKIAVLCFQHISRWDVQNIDFGIAVPPGTRPPGHTGTFPLKDFDEVWLVGDSYDEDARGELPQRGRFRMFDLSELSGLLTPPALRTERNRAKTKIGKSVFANEKEILLAVVGLALHLDAKIGELRGERPNSDQAIAERDVRISEYEQMRAKLENVRTDVVALKKGVEKEANIVKSVSAFADGVKSWWNKAHATIMTKTFDMALFTTAVGICTMAGAGGRMSIVVSAALVGGKPVAQALKGLLPNVFWLTNTQAPRTCRAGGHIDRALQDFQNGPLALEIS